MTPTWPMLDDHVILAELLQPASQLILGVPKIQQPDKAMVVRTYNKSPAQQVMAIHACEPNNSQEILAGSTVPSLLCGQGEAPTGYGPLLPFLNLAQLGSYGFCRGIRIQHKLTIGCR